jgi:rare lipoprotein A
LTAATWTALGAAVILALACLLWGSHAHGAGMHQCGLASWYSYTGHRTASGVPYTGREMTAAHRSLPFGTRVRVTDQRTGRSVLVTITDRGPYVRGRVIDLSPVAKRALGMGGLAVVCLS